MFFNTFYSLGFKIACLHRLEGIPLEFSKEGACRRHGNFEKFLGNYMKENGKLNCLPLGMFSFSFCSRLELESIFILSVFPPPFHSFSLILSFVG